MTTKTDVTDSTTDAVTITEYGLTTSATSKTGVTVTFDYDNLGRQTETTDPRIGTTVTHYNGKGQVDFVRDPANHETRFSYDPVTGRKTAQTSALGKNRQLFFMRLLCGVLRYIHRIDDLQSLWLRLVIPKMKSVILDVECVGCCFFGSFHNCPALNDYWIDEKRLMSGNEIVFIYQS